MIQAKITRKTADIIDRLKDRNNYIEALAFISNAQEAAIEARGYLTREQSWDLFTALQDYKHLIEELANAKDNHTPCCFNLFK